MPDYANGKVYSIRSYNTDDVYYGSTVSSLTKRLSQHKRGYIRWQATGTNYITSFEVMKYDDAYIELVENYACDCRGALEKREGQIIRSNNDEVNKNIVGRTGKQYYNDNCKQISAQKKQYYNDHNEQIKSQSKQYYKNNSKQISTRMDQYRRDNSKQIGAQTKQYRKDNSEHISAQKKLHYLKVKAKKDQQRLQHSLMKAYMLKLQPNLSEAFFQRFFKMDKQC